MRRRPTPPRIYDPKGGRPPKHGGEFAFGQPDTWGEPDIRTVTEMERYGTAVATAFDRLHPRLTRRAAWLTHRDELPIIEATVIRLKVGRLPNGADPSRSGCGGRAPARARRMSTSSGTRSCAESTLNTPSE